LAGQTVKRKKKGFLPEARGGPESEKKGGEGGSGKGCLVKNSLPS